MTDRNLFENKSFYIKQDRIKSNYSELIPGKLYSIIKKEQTPKFITKFYAFSCVPLTKELESKNVIKFNFKPENIFLFIKEIIIYDETKIKCKKCNKCNLSTKSIYLKFLFQDKIIYLRNGSAVSYNFQLIN